MDEGQYNRNKRLFFIHGVNEEEKNAIRYLVQINYPGLLDNGYVEWETLHNNRHRRAGGFATNIAEEIVEQYNKIHEFKKNEERCIRINNMGQWNTNPGSIIQHITNDVEIKKTDIHFDIPEVQELFGEHQLVYTPYPKTDWELKYKQEYFSFSKNIEKCNANNNSKTKYIVAPWRHNDNDPNEPMSKWNLLLNQSIATIAVNSNPDTINMRIVLPDNYVDILASTPFNNANHQKMRAVLLLKYVNNNECEDRLPESGFIPLFVFHWGEFANTNAPISNRKTESHTLWNYRALMVDWGDWSKRMTITFYELRDVMAHLASKEENEKWYMYKYNNNQNNEPSSSLIHLFVSKNKLEHANLEQQCFDWTEGKKGIKLTNEQDCKYEGDDSDFKRIGDIKELLKRELLDQKPDTLYKISESKFEGNISKKYLEQESLTYISPNVRCPSYIFGIYGLKKNNTVSDRSTHQASAYGNWKKNGFYKEYGFHPLEILKTVVDISDIVPEEEKKNYAGGSTIVSSWIGIGFGVCSLFAMAILGSIK